MRNIEELLTEEGRMGVLAGEIKGVHGHAHWFNVARTGVSIALAEGGDPEVALLFGFYHDCRRENDGHDPEHGHRGALLAMHHHQMGWLDITQDQLALLMFACEHHSKGSVDSEDATVSSCWDADRLELPRVDCQTDPKYLGTETAKKMATYLFNFYQGEF